jgi:hypothetical protein
VQWEESILSDLANSCEYLTIEKLCSAVSESEKAKANRQERCQNDEKMTCCYICLSRRDCAISCKFLGNIGNESPPVETEKTEPPSKFTDDKKTEAPQTENAPVTCCPLCNVEMSQTRTKFTINGWIGLHPKPVGDDSGEEFLPVIVYLCPQCGKIEFRADEELNKN